MMTWNERLQELYFFSGMFALVFTTLAGQGEPREFVVRPARILHIDEPRLVEPQVQPRTLPLTQWQLFGPTGTGFATGPGAGAGTLAVVS